MSTGRERQRSYLRAELSDLERLIADCEADEELTRMGLDSRREEIAAALEQIDRLHGRVANATIIFRGGPVLEARGIEADFSSRALDSFQRFVSKAASARRGDVLGTRGPTRNEDASRLFITGTVQGSFGFELEEIADPPLVGATPLAEAIDDTTRLLVAAQDDERFADAAAQTDPEVISALSRFLRVVSINGATVRIRAGERDVALGDDDAVAAALARTESTRAATEIDVSGILEGLLPNARRFELRREGGELVAGRLAPSAPEPGAISALLLKHCTARVRDIVFSRPNKEQHRYELLSIEEAH